MNADILRDLREWMALGFYRGIEEKRPWPVPYGMAFRSLYENMEIVIPDDTFLAPRDPMERGRDRRSHGVWTATSAVLDFNHSSGLCLRPEMIEAKKAAFPDRADFIDAMVADLKPRLPVFGGYTHSNPDIRRVVDEGFDAMEAELDAVTLTTTVPEELNLLAALKEYAIGVRAFHSRTASALQAAAASARGPRREKRRAIAEAFQDAFLKPAKTFLQGLLAIHFVWMLDGCDSIGRFDQALGALFDADVAAGRLALDFARELLDDLWDQFDRLNGWNLQLGGYTPDGEDGCNALTLECLEACRRNKFPRPNAAFRITQKTPDAAVLAALRAIGNGAGRPALYNDDLYIDTLLKMDLGLVDRDARELGFGGCTETMIPGMSNVGSLETHLNLAQCLCLALNDGVNPVSGLSEGPHTGHFEEFPTFDAFFAAVKRQIQYATDVFAANSKTALRRRFTEGDPKLARTFFTRDCVRNRKSFEAGGARYNWSVVSYQGISVTIDSLAAIKKLVFDERSIKASALLAALRADFVGHEASRQALLAAPKFGNDDPFVDKIGAELTDFAWSELYRHQTPRGGRYLASCILFTTYLDSGKRVPATPDGRKAFTALNDSIGATAGNDVNGPTALLKSVVGLPCRLAVGTPVLNLRFSEKMFKRDDDLLKLVALIRSFFKMGGLQIQISALSAEALRAAREEPEKHRDLIVRIGGYSEYFTALPEGLRDSVIARTEHDI